MIKLKEVTKKSLILQSAHIVMTDMDVGFYGSNEEAKLIEQAIETAEQCLGVGFTETEVFERHTHKATQTEISEHIIECLLHADGKIIEPNSKIFAVALEANTFECWESYQDEAFDIWSERNISEDAGWRESEAEELAALKKGEHLSYYGDFQHTILRIR